MEQRYVDRFYLTAEVVSESDGPRIELKRNLYRLHPHCRYVLTIRQDRQEVLVDARTDAGWQTVILDKPTDVLAIEPFGLACAIADLYRGTPLQPRGPSAG
jgi:hypothetical protein